MKIEQLYTNCLAQGAYYISHKGEAAIIDPLRETGPYLDMLKQNNDRLTYIFETHFHADFVSGHVDLANATGATIVFGPNAQTTYKSYVAKDHEVFKLGDLSIEVLHTPGHTLESSTFLLKDEKGKDLCIFTGDTLFIGDVGRPDLAIKSNLTQEDLASMLFKSLREKIMPLADDVVVYPAHGAGSACGKNMSKETSDTLGNQKKTNYALSDMTEVEFVKELTTGILPAPQYFAKNALLNKSGYQNFDQVMSKGLKGMNAETLERLSGQANTIVLDVRKPEEFSIGHIPNSIFIGLDGQFAPWVGNVIEDLHTNIILVAPAGRESETVKRLSRVGYDNCIGYLEGGFNTWLSAGKKIEIVNGITAEDFVKKGNGNAKTLDVRRPGEFDVAHLLDAENKPLDFIHHWVDQLDKNQSYNIHCAGGYRSMVTISVLKSKGIQHVTDVLGGFGAIAKVPEALPKIKQSAVAHH
jgi:glyoxylase-like metal-dependent hydrolase (beta-lactamase superfamily II)/rhodanese-related sulfurtransferase